MRIYCHISTAFRTTLKLQHTLLEDLRNAVQNEKLDGEEVLIEKVRMDVGKCR